MSGRAALGAYYSRSQNSSPTVPGCIQSGLDGVIIYTFVDDIKIIQIIALYEEFRRRLLHMDSLQTEEDRKYN